MDEPQGRFRRFSDEQLREDLAAGLRPAQIADKHGVSRPAVSKRISRLEVGTVSAVTAPEESRRFVRSQVDAAEVLAECLQRVRLLQDACDRYLRDPEHPGQYDVGPRAADVEVIYWRVDDEGNRAGRKPARENLQTLLDRVGGIGEVERAEYRQADPRELLLSTSTECRRTVESGLALTQRLLDARAQQVWREEVLGAIAEVDPGLRNEIADRIRRRLSLFAAFGGPGALPDPGERDGED
jgi:hypothetical protein